jgi:tRNA(Met) C34 N-acetyltransferase TmcA
MNFYTILFPMTVLNTQFQQQYAQLSFTESKSKAVPLLAMQALRGRGKSSTDV